MRSKRSPFASHRQPDYQTYTKHLESIIHPSCAKCHKIACLACGEKVDPTAIRSGQAVFRVDGPTSQLGKGVTEYDKLLHCFDIQGILIGVGLHLIERSFGHKTAAGSESSSPPTKKRKKLQIPSLAPASTGTWTPDPDGDDDDDYDVYDVGLGGGSGSTGSRAAKGTGYAGAGTEDVGCVLAVITLTLVTRNQAHLSVPVNDVRSRPKRPRMLKLASSSSRSGCIFPRSTALLGRVRATTLFILQLLRIFVAEAASLRIYCAMTPSWTWSTVG